MTSTTPKFRYLNNSITIWLTSGPATIGRTHPRFDEIKRLIVDEQIEEAAKRINVGNAIDQYSNGRFSFQDGRIVIDGEALPPALSDALVDLVQSGGDTTRLERFWANLAQNPATESRQDLYDFLMANKVAITADGCFIVYKRVNDNLKDLYQGTVQYALGKVASMDRDLVDDNRNNTCSTGLHVAAFEYADQHYNSGRGVILECKVNPRDVVAVPPDYNQQKMRVCALLPIKVVGAPTTTPVYNDPSEVAAEKIVNEKFEPLTVTAAANGRVRIPGVAVRRTGVGVGREIFVYATTKRSGFLRLSAEKPEKAFACRAYRAQQDNSIRLSPDFLAEARCPGTAGRYTVQVKRGAVEVRPN